MATELIEYVSGINSVVDTTGVDVTGFSNDELVTLAHKFSDFKSMSSSAFYWGIGDIIVEAEARGENVVVAVVESAGISIQEGRNCAYVSRHIPKDERFPVEGKKMTWAHHRPTASLSSGPRKEILTKARDLKLSVKDIEVLVRAYKEANNLLEPQSTDPDKSDAESPDGGAKISLVTMDEVLSFIKNCDPESLIRVEESLKERIDQMMGPNDSDLTIDKSAFDKVEVK